MLLEPIKCAGKLFQIIIVVGKNSCLDGFLNIHRTTIKNTEYNAVTCTRVALQNVLVKTVQRTFERGKVELQEGY